VVLTSPLTTMKPISFSEVNGTVADGRVNPTTPDSPLDLPVYRDGKEILSCWRPSWRERIAILIRGRVWLVVATPLTHPPVMVDGGRVFERD